MKFFSLFLALFLLAGPIPSALADDRHNRADRVEAELSGYNEVHFIAGNPTVTPVVPPALRGAVSTKASGKFEATIDDKNDTIHYTLRYDNLEGTVTQAHIHFGQRHTVGGIVVWLCQTAAAPAPASVNQSTPTCPASGAVSGTIMPAQVLEAVGQGIAPGEFEEVVAAIRAGRAYANVHSSLFPPGEIRGQIHDDHRGRR
ncbi:MAG: CHRD domain-containing protein [Candidatus Rokuibacteriota bacterium]|jgi:hypothetical protein